MEVVVVDYEFTNDKEKGSPFMGYLKMCKKWTLLEWLFTIG